MQTEGKALIMDEKAMGRAINRISYEIIERDKGAQDLCIIGIFSRGVELAARIAEKIQSIEQRQVPVGCLDITPYRDDQKKYEGGPHTDISFPLDGKQVILVDDVIYTGRSARAAIDGILSMGRPKRIQLAVLIDRGHRELPLRADFIGKNVPTSREEEICVYVRERDGEDCVIIR
ncbi:MAG: bifunctional pyr operon transcriptional regulator/uracil phosphoribosyltransferase PyrR [Candidatus Faecivivens sp.]|nr:bifunctional pyr operon transcriptional regulator/uracil phosphoribosyltransferase PyrR [Oscillospiraceae bacterium]MDY2713292.1 bifunctional pyr operon transcriptional regulator/uracil phosphoribosyltransferase PyrR [Candidatus Faecivivens sp.]